MKIKYIKDAPQGKTGEVIDIDSLQANALIALGFAEEYKEEKPKSTTKKATVKKDNS